MKYRIAMWSSTGFLVAVGWALYFASAGKDNPIEPIVSALIRLTCPIAIAGSHYPISIYLAVIANVATYAVAGLIVETLRRQRSHSR